MIKEYLNYTEPIHYIVNTNNVNKKSNLKNQHSVFIKYDKQISEFLIFK